MKTKVTEFNAYRSEMNDKILNSGFSDFKKFFALDNKAYHPGALDSKTKELMGLSASMVLRCNDCIYYHIERSIIEGASREELMETFNVSLIVGGSIVIPHLRSAFEFMEQVFESRSNTSA